MNSDRQTNEAEDEATAGIVDKAQQIVKAICNDPSRHTDLLAEIANDRKMLDSVAVGVLVNSMTTGNPEPFVAMVIDEYIKYLIASARS